jgi:hypothetical protein
MLQGQSPIVATNHTLVARQRNDWLNLSRQAYSRPIILPSTHILPLSTH